MNPIKKENFFGFIDELTNKPSLAEGKLSPERQTQEGSFLLIDDSKVFGDKVFPDLQRSFDALVKQGAKVVIITTDDTGRTTAGQELSSEAYLNKVLQDEGYGSVETGDFDQNVIACLLNYELGEVICTIGENWFDAITKSEIEEAQDMIIAQAGNGSPENNQTAIRIALEFFEDEILETTVSSKNQTNTSGSHESSSDSSTAETASDNTEEGNVISVPTETQSAAKSELIAPFIGGFLFIAIGMLAIWKGIKFTRRQRTELKNIAELTGEINLLHEQYVKEMAYDLAERRYAYLMSKYAESYPEKAEEVQERLSFFQNTNKKINDLAKLISENKIRLYSKSDSINLVKQAQLELKSQLEILLKEIDSTENEFFIVDTQIEQSRAKFETAKKSFEELQSTVNSLNQKYPEYIPEATIVLKKISAQLTTADEYTNPDSPKVLLGNDMCSEISQDIDKTNNVLTLFTTSIDTVSAIESGLETKFAKWQIVEQPTDLITSVKRSLKEISASISNGESIENLKENVEVVQKEIKSFIQYVSALEESLQSVDRDSITLQSYFNENFSEEHIADTLTSRNDLVKRSITNAKNGIWSSAIDEAQLIDNKSAQAVETLKTLKELRNKNTSQIQELSKDVASAQTTLMQTLSGKWQELQSKYKQENYSNIKSNFDEAKNLLLEIFDDPSDENDLASQAEKENSMSKDKQNFREAENLISALNRKLVRAKSLMDELSSRYDLVISSEQQYQAAILAAEKQIQTAIQTKSGPSDQMVDSNVDTMIKNAQDAVAKAKQSGENKNYVLAYQLAQDANRIAIEARQDAEDQIKKIQSLYSDLEQEKSKQRSLVTSAFNKIDAEADAVVSPSTMEAARKMKNDLTNLEVNANSFAQYEDTQLANQLEAAIEQLKRLGSYTVQEALNMLKNDQQEHQQQIDSAKRAIASAEEAIQAAREKVNNYRAGSSGDTQLNQAISEKPNPPVWGTQKSEIDKITNKAINSKRLADQAYAIANQAIKDRIEEEEERERKRRAEEAEKRRQEEKERQERQEAADRKRKEERDRQDAQRRRDDDRRRDQQMAEASRRSSQQRTGTASGGLRR